MPRVNDVWAQRFLWANAYFWMGLVVLRVYQLRFAYSAHQCSAHTACSNGVKNDPMHIFDPAAKMRFEREQKQRDHDIVHVK